MPFVTLSDRARKRRQAPLAFSPIYTKARELDGRILLAAHLAVRGYRVLIGSESAVNEVALRCKGGLYLSPLLLPRLLRTFQRLQSAGHLIIGWNEEGLVYPAPNWYFANRSTSEVINCTRAVLAWGEVSAADMTAAYRNTTSPILPIGNPRIDVLQRPFRAIYDDAASAIRGAHGQYILVNTNFDLINHYNSSDWLMRQMRLKNYMALDRDRLAFESWARFRHAAFDCVRAATEALCQRFPNIRIIIRPHPSENPEPWKQLALAYPNARVMMPNDAVIPWLMGATAVLHNSCTTAVEAFMLGTPAVAIEPPAGIDDMSSPLPNNLSIQTHSPDEVCRIVGDLLQTKEAYCPGEKLKQIAGEHIAAIDGETSCERILTLIDTLGFQPTPGSLPAFFTLANIPGRVKAALASTIKQVAGLTRLGDRDVQRRLPGLRHHDIAVPLETIGAIMQHKFVIYPHGNSAYVIESAES